GPGPLLERDELSARVVHVRPVESDHDLQREHELAVEVAVQGVPVARPVAEQERGRPGLPCLVALLEPVVETVRPWRRLPQASRPRPGDRQEMRPERGPQLRDQLRQRLVEVAVLALSEPVAGHLDGRAKAAIVAIELRDPLALRRPQDVTRQRGTKVVEAREIAVQSSSATRVATGKAADPWRRPECGSARMAPLIV